MEEGKEESEKVRLLLLWSPFPNTFHLHVLSSLPFLFTTLPFSFGHLTFEIPQQKLGQIMLAKEISIHQIYYPKLDLIHECEP